MNPGQKANLQDLKVILQIMALPVTGQLRVGADRVGAVATLIQAFQYCLRAELETRETNLTERQESALLDLASVVARLEPLLPCLTWSEELLRRSSLWRQLRRSARMALVEFDWSLELPEDEPLFGASGNRASDWKRTALVLDQLLPEACQAVMLTTIAR